ncbi:glycosyltransferase [Dehalococcoidia bacterium]|nr:glycosyltransferase [Dehalococcoidia bacterium]
MNVYLQEVAKDLGRRGICVDIFTRVHEASDPMIVALGDNARVIHLKAGPVDAQKHDLYRYLPDFTHSLTDFIDTFDLEYNLIHSHYWLSGLPGLVLSEARKIPTVASFHSLGAKQPAPHVGEPESGKRIASEEHIVQTADRLIAASPDEKEQLIRLYHANPARTDVVPCGYNDKIFYPRNRGGARTNLNLNHSQIVLFVGRLTPLKGADILLRAVASMDDSRELGIVVVGGNQGEADLKQLQQLAKRLGIGSQVYLQGAAAQSNLPEYYSAADVCVVPSYYETFGLVALESMACGTPVIASRVGGLRSTVTDGKTGYLVPWHCPEPFARRLETILSNNVLRESFGKAGLESVQGLTWSSTTDNLLDTYGTVLGQGKEFLQLVPCS